MSLAIVPISSAAGYFMAGASNGGGTTAKRYLAPFDASGSVITAENAFHSPVAATITRIRYYADAAGTTVSSGTSTYGLEVNGVEVATITTSITVASGSTTCSVAIAKGDKIAFTLNHAGSVTTGHTRPKMFAEF